MVKSLNARTVEACKFSLNLVEEALYGVHDGGDTGNTLPEKRSRLVDDLSVMLKVPDRESERHCSLCVRSMIREIGSNVWFCGYPRILIYS